MSDGVTMTWDDSAFMAKFNGWLGRNLDKAAIFLQKDISRSFPGVDKPEGQKGAATKAQRHANRSNPGEIPHVDTGHLKRNVGYEPGKKKDTRWIGTGLGGRDKVSYAAALEFGTSKMDARPYLDVAIKRNRGVLMRILTGGKA